MEEISHMGGVDLISRRTGNISNTESATSFPSGLHFQCSWACSEDDHKHYKIMHIHIIVHHVRKITQDESLTSLQETNR